MKISKETLELDKKLCEQASPGPWYWRKEWSFDSMYSHYNGAMGELQPNILDYGMDGAEDIYCPKKENSDFIVRSRTALPEYIDEVEILQKENEELKHAEMGMRCQQREIQSFQKQIQAMKAPLEMLEKYGFNDISNIEEITRLTRIALRNI